MFDTALVKDLTEMLGKSLTFKDVEAVGGYIFKDHGFSVHTVAGVNKGVSISSLNAAKALVQVQLTDIGDDADQIVQEFRTRFYDSELFFDPFAGGKFANYLFHAHQAPHGDVSPDAARRRIEEAQLFIEAAHACYNRLSQQLVAL